LPWSADFRYHCAASASSCVTPRPWPYNRGAVSNGLITVEVVRFKAISRRVEFDFQKRVMCPAACRRLRCRIRCSPAPLFRPVDRRADCARRTSLILSASLISFKERALAASGFRSSVFSAISAQSIALEFPWPGHPECQPSADDRGPVTSVIVKAVRSQHTDLQINRKCPAFGKNLYLRRGGERQIRERDERAKRRPQAGAALVGRSPNKDQHRLRPLLKKIRSTSRPRRRQPTGLAISARPIAQPKPGPRPTSSASGTDRP
jgi:hypothetical protein